MGCFPSVYEINSYLHLMYMYGYFATGAVDYPWHLCVSMSLLFEFLLLKSYRYVSSVTGSSSFDEYTKTIIVQKE